MLRPRAPVALLSLVAACGGDAPTDDVVTDAAPPNRADGAPTPDDGPSPAKPAGLTTWLVGDDADAEVTPLGPGLVLLGGGADVGAAFAWWDARLAGGDVVVLRTSGADGYNEYLYRGGAVDSVETMLVTSRELADSDYVAWRVRHAEGVFIAGGDQSEYVAAWRGTALAAALATVWARGGLVGGTSAGTAVLGEFVYTGERGSVVSAAALADPYDADVTLARDVLTLPALAGVVTDSHVRTRDRLGRLVGFVARVIADGWRDPPAVRGLGVDEATAVLVDGSGHVEVVGDSAAYLVVPDAAPATCIPGKPLVFTGLKLFVLRAGDTAELAAGAASVPARPLAAQGGMLSPGDPY